MTKKSNSFVGAVGLTFVSLMLANVLSYLFQLSMGRFFEPKVFSEIQSLLGVFMVAVVPATSLSMLVTRQTSERLTVGLGASLRGFACWLYLVLAAVTLILLVGAWLLSDSFAHALAVREPLAVTVLALCFGLSLFQLVSGSTLQGLQDFTGFNSQQLVATALKIVTLFIALALLPTASGVLIGVAASSGFAALYAYVRAQRFYALHDGAVAAAVNAADAGAVAGTGGAGGTAGSGARLTLSAGNIIEISVVLLANLGFAALTQIDVIYSNRSFPSDVAASFAATVMLAKALTYIPTALTIVLFPRVTQLAQTLHSGPELNRLILRSMAVTTAVLLAGVAVLGLFESLIHSIVFAGKFKYFEEHLQLAAWAYLPSALALPLMQILIAMRSRLVWIAPSMSAVGLLAILAMRPLDPRGLLLAIAATSTVCLLGLAAALWARLSASRSVTEDEFQSA
jgi:O-antigen/teichoic acid export membrane protein